MDEDAELDTEEIGKNDHIQPSVTNLTTSSATLKIDDSGGYHFSRYNLFSMSFVLLLLIFMIPLVLEYPTSAYFYIGGAVGIVSSSMVLLVYLANPQKRTSSMSLLFFRAICDMGIGFRFLFNFYVNRDVCHKNECHLNDIDEAGQCAFGSASLEFFELASEAWFFCLAVDLFVTITNPFSSFKQRLKWYHIFCWTFAFVMGVVLGTVNDLNGFWYLDSDVDDTAICWIKFTHNSRLFDINYRPWILLYIPLCVVYIFSLYVMINAYSHLSKGISKTFQHRVKVLVQNSINIGIYLGYWAVLLTMYIFSYIFSDTHADASRWFWRLLLFGISSKGFADLLVFIMVSDSNSNDSISGKEALDLNSALRQEVLFFATTGIRECASLQCSDSQKGKIMLIMSQSSDQQNILTVNHLLRLLFSSGEDTISTEADGDIMHFQTDTKILYVDEFDHENLRNSFGNYGDRATSVNSTKSNRRASLGSIVSGSKSDKKSEDFVVDMTSSPIHKPRNLIERLFVKTDESISISKSILNVFSISCLRQDEGNVIFSEYEPYHFRRIRLASGIEDKSYISSFAKTIKERLTEGGASGAFFFFSKDETFIAKSCTIEEFLHIRRTAETLANYFEQYTQSYITRIYGLYRLVIYGTMLHFFVTNNIFLNPYNEVINEKYDIKGSTVNRNCSLPQIGQRVTCCNCNQKYSFVNYKKLKKTKNRREKKALEESMGTKCPMNPLGRHEPSVILKDNDLKHKIRLPKQTARILYLQLIKDTELLNGLRVMDYSLLVGVHITEYGVHDISESIIDTKTQLEFRNAKKHRSASILIKKTSKKYDENEVVSPIYEEKENDSKKSATYSKEVDSSKACFEIDEKDTLGESSPPSFLDNHRKSGDSIYGIQDSHLLTGKSSPLAGRLQVSRVVGPESYYVGIVDYQQQWTWEKRAEHWLKVYLKGENGEGLSAIEPDAYRLRFLRRMEDLLDLDDDNDSKV